MTLRITFSICVYLFIWMAGVLQYDLQAQTFEPYDWNPERSLTSLSVSDAALNLFYLEKNQHYQLVYENNETQLVSYITTHHIIRVNNDDALSEHNKIYIPMTGMIELAALKARAITKTGKVINLDQSNLKEIENEDASYKIFAVEGAEVGGEIEYFYTRKTNSSNFITNVIQSSYPIKSYQFSLSCPENLRYKFKVYNGSDEMTQTDTSKVFNKYVFNAKDIKPMYEEGFSAFENEKLRVELKLDFDTKKGNHRQWTWADAGKLVYDRMINLSKAEQKAFSKFVGGLSLSSDPMTALRQFEHMAKEQFFYQKDVAPAAEQLDQLLKNKYSSSRGLTKLYVTLLEKLNIEYELVLACDRMTRRFDGTFDSWNYLDEYLIYLPNTKLFMSPKDLPFRLGTIPAIYLGSEALFIRVEKIQNFDYPIGYINTIPEPGYKSNMDVMDITASFDIDAGVNEVHAIRSFTGYNASYYKASLNFLEGERRQELLDEVIKYLATDAKIDKLSISKMNADYDIWDLPLEFTSDFTTETYMELAGDVILFKMGELIGPQSELYQENERLTSVVNASNRGYDRILKINIPEGYEIKNIQDLIIKEEVKEGDKSIYLFDSNYTVNDGAVDVVITEYYDQIDYPKAKFEAFRKVVNAAADFNKIVLVFEPVN